MAKTLVGTVSSDKVDKTIVVTVRTRKTHPLYRKQYTVSTKFMAHDEQNEAKLGDKVSIVETRPLSARKRFKLEKVLDRAAIEHKEETDVLEEVKSAEVKGKEQPERRIHSDAPRDEKNRKFVSSGEAAETEAK